MGDAGSVWTPEILARLGEWQAWAAETVGLHYRRAYHLRMRVTMLGVSAVALSAAGATLVMASSGDLPVVWIVSGLSVAGAAAAAGLQTFMRYGEEAEEHRQIAERWFGLSRELDEVLALHPDYLATRSEPERYVDDLRARIEDASARGPFLIESGRWREIAAQQRLDFRAATIAAAGMREKSSPRPAERGQSLFTPAVKQLLEDWERRAAASSGAHLAVGQRLRSLNVRLGVSATVLLSCDAALFLVLRGTTPPSSRMVLGFVSLLAASLVAFNTFLGTTQRAAKHGITAESWEALRSEIESVTRDPPRRAREDPKAYLDDVRRQMDDLSAVSPEVDERAWVRALAGGARRPSISTTDAAERFASMFPGINLRVEDEGRGAAA